MPDTTGESRPDTTVESASGTVEPGPGAVDEAPTAATTPATAPTAASAAVSAPAASAPASASASAAAGPLLPPGESDRLGRRLHDATAGFVDAPRASVEEADRVLEELTARLTDAVAHRRRALHTSWQETGPEGGVPSTDTEQLRLALRDYRELADRLMRL